MLCILAMGQEYKYGGGTNISERGEYVLKAFQTRHKKTGS
jgi:hypothetical protein